MKIIKGLSLVLSMLMAISLSAQQGINYKALIKDGSGNVVANQTVTIQFTIYKGDDFTKIKLKETHAPTTDANGIV
ncbi:MAG: hypothetical protein KJN59_00345, partial [Bacteroidia bacterium]|nr:hypothetical protein [Bacteroidia bacterium]